MAKSKLSSYKDIRYYIIGAGLLLIIVICAVMFGMAIKQGRLIKEQVYEEARALFDEIVIMRRWNAHYGGVYVLKKPGDVSNPYLENPDITDKSGSVYTLKNPATMTREVSTYAESDQKFSFHITSLRLKNPNNKLDEWERQTLISFEKGKSEETEVIKKDGRHFYRFMRPLLVEESCLNCHRDQGYKVGEVRGGISVTLPYDKPYSALRLNHFGMAGLAFMLVAIFAAVLYFFVWRLMDRLAKQNRELEILNETKDRFLGIAAHDLRNPLTVVNVSAKLLQDRTTEPTHLTLLNNIGRATQKMLALINSLLDVSKIKSGKLEIRPEDVDVAKFLKECFNENEMIGKQKGIALVLSVPEDIGHAQFDKERIHQAVDNLLSNAFKYSNSNTTVTLGAKRSERGLEIWVEDQGVGIKDEDLPLLFEEFSKTSAQPTAGESSHGLGLAIVKRVVELQGGRIEAKSHPGGGAIFTIMLP